MYNSGSSPWNTPPEPFKFKQLKFPNSQLTGALYFSITECPEDAFSIDVYSPNERVRRRLEKNYLGHGLFLVQYRMYGDYPEVFLSVTHEGKHVPKSPYFLGVMLHEDCACPLWTVEEWLAHFGCSQEESQIAEDLEPFRSEGVNVTGLYERAGQAYSRNSFVHYSIIDGKVSDGIRAQKRLPGHNNLC